MRVPAITRKTELNDEQWDFVKQYHPDLALKMIRNKRVLENYNVMATAKLLKYMNQNFVGLFYQSNSSCVLVELDEDLALLTMKF